MRVYVASSWRNLKQPEVVAALRNAGHDVYDFRHPTNSVGDDGFHWSEIDPDWQNWSSAEFVQSLEHPLSQEGFKNDMDALGSADVAVLVMPCGRSAHLELGYAVGAGKHTAILLSDADPELMYKMADMVTDRLSQIIDWLNEGEPTGSNPWE